MMSSEPQLGQRRKGGMLDIGDEDGDRLLFYLPFTKRHYPGFLSESATVLSSWARCRVLGVVNANESGCKTS